MCENTTGKIVANAKTRSVPYIPKDNWGAEGALKCLWKRLDFFHECKFCKWQTEATAQALQCDCKGFAELMVSMLENWRTFWPVPHCSVFHIKPTFCWENKYNEVFWYHKNILQVKQFMWQSSNQSDIDTSYQRYWTMNIHSPKYIMCCNLNFKGGINSVL